MGKLRRIRDVLFGVSLILFAVLLFVIPDVGFGIAAMVIGIMMLLYGFKTLIFYFTMARYAVGGKTILFQAVLILDLALFTGSMAFMDAFTILFYLFGVFAFSGVVDILRSFEAKRFESRSWRLKLITGYISVMFAVMMLILGVIFRYENILVYGFAASLIYAAVTKIVTAMRKTAIIYIQ